MNDQYGTQVSTPGKTEGSCDSIPALRCYRTYIPVEFRDIGSICRQFDRDWSE